MCICCYCVCTCTYAHPSEGTVLCVDSGPLDPSDCPKLRRRWREVHTQVTRSSWAAQHSRDRGHEQAGYGFELGEKEGPDSFGFQFGV